MHKYWLIAIIVLVIFILPILYYLYYKYRKIEYFEVSNIEQEVFEMPTAYGYLLKKRRWPVDTDLDQNLKNILFMMRAVVQPQYVDHKQIHVFTDHIKLPEEGMDVFGIVNKSRNSIMTIEHENDSIDVEVNNSEIYFDCSKNGFSQLKRFLEILYGKINSNGKEYDKNMKIKIDYIDEKIIQINKSTKDIENDTKAKQEELAILNDKYIKLRDRTTGELCW